MRKSMFVLETYFIANNYMIVTTKRLEDFYKIVIDVSGVG